MKVLKSTFLPQLTILLIAVLGIIPLPAFGQGVGISEISITPDASAILEVRSTVRGFLPPRLTTGERDAIGSPATGLFLYNTSIGRFNYRDGSWISLISSSDNISALSSSTSLQLETLLSDETGSGAVVFANAPVLVTPTLGAASATSINNITLTNPGTTATLTLANNSTLVTSGANSITLTSTGATNVTLPASGTLYGTTASSISSAQLAASMSDETGTGVVVFGTGPAFTGFSSSGATVSINDNSNFNTNINTGTSTGAIAIGNSASTGITQNVGTGNFSLNGTTASTYSIGAATTTGTITIGGTAQTGTMTLGSSSGTNTLAIANGAGATTLNLANVQSTGAVNIGTAMTSGDITIGSSGTTNGNGIRFGTSRVVKNYPTAPTTGGTTTLSTDQVLDAGIYVINANSTITFPTAALLVAALPNAQVGDVINFAIASTGNNTPTIAAGTGGTIGSQTTGVARVTRYLSIRITNIGAGTEAYIIY